MKSFLEKKIIFFGETYLYSIIISMLVQNSFEILDCCKVGQ
jgi:hypothetical protein